MRLATLEAITNEEPKLHRYPNIAAKWVKAAAKQLVRDYRADADLVFDVYSARELYLRLINFTGIGDKKANMGVRLAVEYVGYEYYDLDQIHLPVNVQVIRVFRRAGLVAPTEGRAEIQAVAKSPLEAGLGVADRCDVVPADGRPLRRRGGRQLG